MNNRFNRHQTKETLLNRQQRLQTLMKADVPILEAIQHYQAVDPHSTLARTARGLSICLGE